jgi:hypothetical protein
MPTLVLAHLSIHSLSYRKLPPFDYYILLVRLCHVVALSPFQQRAFKGVLSGYLFNGYTRLAAQTPYFFFPFAAGAFVESLPSSQFCLLSLSSLGLLASMIAGPRVVFGYFRWSYSSRSALSPDLIDVTGFHRILSHVIPLCSFHFRMSWMHR